jgi:hypothetical protein
VPRRLDAGNQEQSLCDDHTIRNNIGYTKEVIPGGQIETLPVPIIPWTGHMTLKGRTKDTNHSQDRNKALQNGSLKVILMNRGQAANKCRER